MATGIDESLLIAAPMLQDAIISKIAEPLAAGVITLYQDNARTVLKNWYFQTGIPGAYTYTTLPNPMTLSASGTICDSNGNDVIPFFYPYIENEFNQITRQPYYITVYDAFGNLQFTRANFPFAPSSNINPNVTTNSANNLIINNRFWRNAGTVTLTTVTTPVSICPDQHDAFLYPYISFSKSVSGATDVATFTSFTPSASPVLKNDITPEFYINHTCSGIQTGELFKYYQFPLSAHIATLANQPFTFTIQGQSVSGSNIISASILQFTGSGTTSPSSQQIANVNIALTPSWTKTTLTDIFQSNVGIAASPGYDDGFYLQINMPLGTDGICNLNFALPSIYLGANAPTSNFLTYDQIGAIIDSPRTGDVRTSVNYFYPYGWIPMNDGTIGNTGSAATTRANNDTWLLYNLIWTNVSRTWAPLSTTSLGTAILDFMAGTTLALTKALGQVFAGTATGSTALGTAIGATSVALVANNIPAHTHASLSAAGFLTPSPGSGTLSSGGLQVNTNLTTANNATTNAPFSVIQPTVFMNFYIKL